MNPTLLQAAFQLGDRRPLDRWLRFVGPIQTRYDEENAVRRVQELRSAIYIGLALYNIYNITSVVLLPDILVLSVVLRLGIVTPISLALVWLIGRTSPHWTERLVTIGSFNAYLVPVFLFWASNDGFALFTFGELPLTIIFANMLLALRFPHAVLFTFGALAATLAAVVTKSGLDVSLGVAFLVQIATACAFSLYANYIHERRRCLDFLGTLTATLEASTAYAVSQAYRDLSRTDALTQLPNRRHLTDRLEEWLSRHQPIAMMMIDIDHFKLFNDALGHPSGDDCLQRVAKAFSLVVAETENAFCARFGGEEFTFALYDVGELETARVARSILKSVSDLAISHPSRGDGVGIVTVSIGVMRCNGDVTRSLQDVLAAADRLLYFAKRRGRNRFVVGDERQQFGEMNG